MARINKQHKASILLELAIKKLLTAGIGVLARPIKPAMAEESMENLALDERIVLIKRLFQTQTLETQTLMTFFVFYDIENDKVRTHIAKYLQRMGCVRIQKSVFMAKTERKNYEIIATSLSKIQKAYNNMDSIMLVPIPEDDARAMRIIGHKVDVAMILNTTGTFWV